MKLAAKLEPKPIPHLVWDGSGWVEKPNKKHPMVNIKYRLAADGYSAVGRAIPRGEGHYLKALRLLLLQGLWRTRVARLWLQVEVL